LDIFLTAKLLEFTSTFQGGSRSEYEERSDERARNCAQKEAITPTTTTSSIITICTGARQNRPKTNLYILHLYI